MNTTLSQTKHPIKIPIWLILLIAALNGLVYVFLVPPWQNPDEMGQLEYIRLIATLNRLPHAGEYDQALRREIVSSMVESGFYRKFPLQPNLIAIDQPLWIGAEQVSGLPFYYWIAALPLRFISQVDVLYQLYILRIFSLLISLVTIWVTASTAAILFPRQALSWFIAAFVAMMPGFASKLVAINDDVMAILSLSIFVWLSVWLLEEGFSWWKAVGLILSVLSCYYSKQNSWSAILLAGLVLVLSLFRPYRVWVWIAAALLVVGGLVYFIEWDKPTPELYYPNLGVNVPLRYPSEQAPAGKSVMLVDDEANKFYQVLDPKRLQGWNGKQVSLGFWAWSSTGDIEQPFPQIIVDGQPLNGSQKSMVLTTTPQFFSSVLLMPDQFQRSILNFNGNKDSLSSPIFLDCFILVKGDQSNTVPKINDPNCEEIEWGNYQGKNAIRNASMEKGWFRFKKLNVAGPIPMDQSFLYKSVMGLFDPPASSKYLTISSQYLFMTFWGRFGWGTIPYLGKYPYALFIALTIFALIGWLVLMKKKQFLFHWSTFFFFVIMIVIQIILVYLRYAGSWEQEKTILPQARYFFPVIIPVSAMLGVGWMGFYRLFKRERYHTVFVSLSLVGLELLNVWAWVTIWMHYKN